MLEPIVPSSADSMGLVEREIEMLQYSALTRFLGPFGRAQCLCGFWITWTLFTVTVLLCSLIKIKSSVYFLY